MLGSLKELSGPYPDGESHSTGRSTCFFEARSSGVASSSSSGDSSSADMFPRRVWDRYVIQGMGTGSSSIHLARMLEPKDSSGGLCAIKCLGSRLDDHDGGGGGARSLLEKVLEVLDRLVECQVSAWTSAPPRESSSEFVDESGSVFLQKIYDIFCGNEKVYVVQSYCERNLADPAIAAWFRLPVLTETSVTSIFLLDPDGTFQQHTERIYQDVMHSLRLLAAELALGILFLHKLGIVHQDIKPSNIMITPSGHVQISDYGAASLLPKLLPGLPDLSDLGCASPRGVMPNRTSVAGFSEKLTFTRKFEPLVVGLDEPITLTPRYAAPELLEHDEQGLIVYDERVDWWSFGLVLCELGYGSERPDSGELGEDDSGEGFCHFLSQLLVVDPKERSDGPAVRDHRFFNFERQTWDEIMDLRHPPCPPIIIPTSRLSFGENGTYRSSLSFSSRAGRMSQIQITDTGPSLITDEGHDQKSDIQPFPSTASLYQYSDSRPAYRINREIIPQIVALSEDPNDSGLGLPESFMLLAESGVESDGDGSDGELKDFEALQRYTGCPCSSSPAGRCEQHGLGEDWVDMTVDEMVVLSLLQARDDINAQLAEDWRPCKIRVKIRPKKARIIARASMRIIRVVSRYICAAVQCR